MKHGCIYGKKMRAEDRKEKTFWSLLLLLAAANFFRFFEKTITEYNTTLFAMSYRYGFISRGMLGTVWAGLDRLLPWDLMTYRAVYIFTLIVTLLLYVVMFLFFYALFALCGREERRNMRYLCVFAATFLFSMFLTDEVFGRLDLYLYLLTFLAMILLLKGKAEILVLPVVALCMCFHQGYLLTNANLLAVLLLYRMFLSTGEQRRRYRNLLAAVLLIMAGLFIYFEFFSHAAGTQIYDEVVAAAKALSEDGKSYNKSIVNHEILGNDVFEEEMRMHRINYQEFPVFLLLFLPYPVMAFRFFQGLFRSDSKKRGEGKKRLLERAAMWAGRWKRDEEMPEAAHLCFFLGGLTVLPQMILKVDYGRYVFMTFTYYILTAMCFIAMGDKAVAAQIENSKQRIRSATPFPLAVLLYPMFFMPLHDVVISGAAYRVSTWFVSLFQLVTGS